MNLHKAKDALIYHFMMAQITFRNQNQKKSESESKSESDST